MGCFIVASSKPSPAPSAIIISLIALVIIGSLVFALLSNYNNSSPAVMVTPTITLPPTTTTVIVTPTTTLTPTTPPVTIVQNGSFEIPVVSEGFDTYTAGQTFGDWTVEAESIDLISGNYWQAADGHQSVDLSGTTNGTIFQDLNTTLGKTYDISFALSGNPEGEPSIKSIEVWWGSNLLDTLSFDITGKSNSNMGWTYHNYTATATSNTTRLRFKSLTSGGFGPAIDNVSIRG